jgi:membrane-associated protease RseP (regulator of RpoE activity)
LSNETTTGPPLSASEGDEPVFRPTSVEPPAESLRLPSMDGFVYQPRVRFKHVWWKHILLFVLTLITTTTVGSMMSPTWLGGFWYSATILAILGAHEMGHYLACRYYGVDATLPYFIPLYLGMFLPQTGTLGAVIRIREAFPNRKVLFDVGIAGPIAGFVVLVPALFIGMSLSHIAEAVPNTVLLGKPLLYQFARWLTFGSIPETHLVIIHPMAFAAWFGMLATALNLLPFGQLDGGHITYAVLGRISAPISLATVASAVVMTFFSFSWILMTVLMVAMLLLFGPRHPPVLDDYEPIDSGRRAFAVFALFMLVVCFTPIPLRFNLP